MAVKPSTRVAQAVGCTEKIDLASVQISEPNRNVTEITASADGGKVVWVEAYGNIGYLRARENGTIRNLAHPGTALSISNRPNTWGLRYGTNSDRFILNYREGLSERPGYAAIFSLSANAIFEYLSHSPTIPQDALSNEAGWGNISRQGSFVVWSQPSLQGRYASIFLKNLDTNQTLPYQEINSIRLSNLAVSNDGKYVFLTNGGGSYGIKRWNRVKKLRIEELS